MGGRTVASDEEDDFIEADDQDPKLSHMGEDDMEERDEEEEGDDVEEDDDDEEEEDGQNEYEKDGFIVDGDEDEDEEEEQQESEDERRKKKKKKKRDSHEFRLDDDDLLLVAENTGKPHVPTVNKYKRLKKAARESEAGEAYGFLDDDGSGNLYAEENVQDEIIEEDQQADEDGIDDDDDFIVDDEEINEEGQVIKRSNAFKRPVRHVAGVSSAALQEAHELFGDVDELLERRTKDLERAAANSGELRGNRLEDEFDPIILADKYMTPKDEKIRQTDVPERMQLSEELTGKGEKLTQEQREEESLWVHSQLTGDGFTLFVGNEQVNNEIDQKDILNVLTMLHVSKFEIPFIEIYRKESCSSLLKGYYASKQKNEEGEPKMRWYKLLWAVETLDRKWLLLQKRKIALKGYYQKRFDDEKQKIDNVTRHALRQQLHDTIIEALKDANSDKEVDDVDAKFNLHFPPGEVEAVGQLKRPKRKSMYNICQKAGLREVAYQFGRSAEQFGHHLTLTKIPEADEIESGKDSPEDVALNFICAMFEAPQDVLRGARHMAAVEIGCEPIVRKHIRSIFMDKAVVSTVPTPQGNLIIDPHHQLSRVKWLREKPLNKFVGAEWLLIQKGEDEKLLKVTVKLPEDANKKLISDARENYLSDCVSKSAQMWDEQRKMILDDAFSSFILPSMEKEARSLLTAKAKTWLRMEYGKQLWDKISVAPWKKKKDKTEKDDEIDLDDEESELRVMACCWGPGNPATTFVMLDSSGELVDVLYAGSISTKSRGGAEDQRKINDVQRAVKFMTDHQPHVLCVGASNMNCRQLKEAIFEVIFKIVEERPRDMNEEMASLSSIHIDESLPRLYENSQISSDQLPGQSGIVKRSVALGRYLQSPLAMVATLCGPGKEILSWKLHPHQEFLTPEEKYEVVEQVMVDATNQIGFDVNLAASHEWHSSTLQFVAGLGPRKASALQKEFVREGSIFSRKELAEPLSRKVFHNASGFLRVRRSGAAAASAEIIDLLDDTRIHPESYALANKLAKDVYAEGAPRETDEDEQEMAIEQVRESPELLKRLSIDEYMKSMPEELHKRETLHNIKTELLCGFSDWRTPYAEPSSDEEFWMLAGETEESLSEGRIVQVTVRHIQESRIICTFDSGLKAIVLGDNYSDDGFDAESLRIREGDILTGKIKNVNKNRFQVYLTCKASDMRRPLSTRNHDPYYHEQALVSQDELDTARKQKELAKKHFKPRMIVHPHFQNLTAEEAKQFLLDKEAGEKVIRPSSRGPSFLTLTLKFFDGVYVHKEIAESGKDRKDITSLLRLGKTLTIDGENFEDLDEVMDRYVDPLVGHLKSMISYRKFRKGLKGEVDNMLRAEKAENPNRIVYSFGISHEHPGTFILTYIRGTNPHHEYVGLYPKGFRFRKTDFNSVDRLVSYFQKHIDRPPPDAGVSMRNVAALVPMRDSARGSGGGATVGRAVSGAGNYLGWGSAGRSVPDGGSRGWSWGGGGRGW